MKMHSIEVGPFAVNCYVAWNADGEALVVDPGADSASILAESLQKLKRLPRDTKVYPGHGPSPAIGCEIASNIFLRGDSLHYTTC